MVRVSIGLKPIGDWVIGSGDVPQDELAPILEFDEADGELVEVTAPTLKCESMLMFELLRTSILFCGELKRPADMLAKSSLVWESRPI